MKRILQAATLLAMFSAAGRADAAVCTQANAAGNWTAYLVYAGGGETGVELTCDLKIAAGGKIEGTSCKEYGRHFAIPSGNVTLKDGGKCAYKFALSFPGDGGASDGDGTLAKSFMGGAGRHAGLPFEFQMFKY